MRKPIPMVMVEGKEVPLRGSNLGRQSLDARTHSGPSPSSVGHRPIAVLSAIVNENALTLWKKVRGTLQFSVNRVLLTDKIQI